MKLKNRFKAIRSGVLCALALCFLFAVYAPLELYLGSQADFWFGFPTITGYCLILFAILFIPTVIILFILRLLGKTPYSVALVILFSALISVYVQGTFFTGALPSLDGTAINWGAYTLERIKSYAVIAILLISSTVLIIKFRKVFLKSVMIISGGLFAILTITLVSLVMTTDIENKSGYLQPTDKDMFEYSSDQNLIVFVTDAVDNEVFIDTLKKNPEFSDTFDDFTYYSDALAGYPFTRDSLALMLSGQWNENEQAFKTYADEAYKSSPLLTKLRADNYQIGVYNKNIISFRADEFDGVIENQISIEPYFKNVQSALTLVTKMAAIRYAPWDLKQFGYDTAEYCGLIKQLPEVEYGDIKYSDPSFYQEIKNKNPITVTDDKCARIIHIEGAHVPLRWDKNVNYTKNASYQSNMEATLTICAKYLERLKESGVYDNSVIVILGDHGFHETSSDLLERMNPALMIKGIGAKGEAMTECKTPVSYEQLTNAFCGLLDKKELSELFPENAYPNGRRFLKYWYLKEDTMYEYKVTGHASDISSMKETGTVYKLEQ